MLRKQLSWISKKLHIFIIILVILTSLLPWPFLATSHGLSLQWHEGKVESITAKQSLYQPLRNKTIEHCRDVSLSMQGFKVMPQIKKLRRAEALCSN